MDRKLKVAFLLLILVGIAAIASVFCFSEGIAVLSPKGMIGDRQRDLLLFSTYLMLLVVVPVFFLTFFIAWKYRASNKKAKYNPDWDYSLLAESLWWGIPCVLMIVLGVVTWKGCHELDPFKPIVSNEKSIRIQVVALQWKWLFIYPEQGIATVNFIQFPEKTPVKFEITADAPMNSFWIPELGGQVYAMAGMRSELYLIANGLDTYRGSSANLSGEGFSGMLFSAKSSTADEFHQWVESVKQSSPALNLEEYQKLIEPSQYVPPASFTLADPDLFDGIMMKYMMPM